MIGLYIMVFISLHILLRLVNLVLHYLSEFSNHLESNLNLRKSLHNGNLHAFPLDGDFISWDIGPWIKWTMFILNSNRYFFPPHFCYSRGINSSYLKWKITLNYLLLLGGFLLYFTQTKIIYLREERH